MARSQDFKSLSTPSGSGAKPPADNPSLAPSGNRDESKPAQPQNLVNLSYGYGVETESAKTAPVDDSQIISVTNYKPAELPVDAPPPQPDIEPGLAKSKKEKKTGKDKDLLTKDRWLVRNGHSLTYICLYLFSIMVLFRPYEIIPGLEFLSATAFYFAVVTIAVYLPGQISTEGNLTMLTTEVKAVIALTIIALITIPLAKNPGYAWEQFNDSFIKAVVIFIILINVVRTRQRLLGIIWLSLGIGVYLAVSALGLYMSGQLLVEGYRVEVKVGGLFGNPNEMALHFVTMTPIVIALAIASKSNLKRLVYFGIVILFVGANMVTFSRGGFLGLIISSAVLAWKIGRKYRLNVTIASLLIGGLTIIAAPGNYGRRMLSIVVPGLDPVGSSDQRRELLIRSIVVSLRNPQGIGIGSFPIVGVRNLQTHNAYTQVSAELGILGLIAYLIFIISPFRKLGAIERTLFDRDELNWYYYLAIGLQASIIGYLISSFFASVAYSWFIYYLIAYAVAFRRIYSLENGITGDIKTRPLWKREPAPTT